MAKYEVDAVQEVERALGGPTAGRLRRALEGKLPLSPGQLARLAEGFSTAALKLKERAKAEVVLDQGKAIDAGVVFTEVRAHTRESLDTKAAKLLLPRAENPDLYSDSEVAANITVAVGPLSGS